MKFIVLVLLFASTACLDESPAVNFPSCEELPGAGCTSLSCEEKSAPAPGEVILCTCELEDQSYVTCSVEP